MSAIVNPNAGQLDSNQILQRGFDEATDKFRVDASISDVTIIGEVAVEIDAADGDNIALANQDGSLKVTVTTVGADNGLDVNVINTVPVSQSGQWDITDITGTISLPTGASTAANQVIEQGKLDTIDADLVVIQGKQDTGNASLSSIDGKITTTVNGIRVDVQASALPTGAATEASLAKLTLTQGSTTSGQSGPLVQGAVTTADPTYTTAQTDPLSLTTTGRLRIDATGNVASAATDSGNPIKTGGIINLNGSLFTNAQRANTQMNAAGSTYIDKSGRLLSYSAFSSFTTVASATDIFTITGSDSRTIKIRNIVISGTNTGNTSALVIMLKRSTANTGGTSTTLTNVPNDSNNAAATATIRSYTANPTLGTLVGNLKGGLLFLPVLASSNRSDPQYIKYGDDGEQPITLRGTSEVFAINLNGVALGGTTIMNIGITWTEE